MTTSERKPERAENVRAYVDSNLFLQFKALSQIDWPSLLNAKRVELVVASVVLRELEQKKQGDNKRLRKRAVIAIEMITTTCVGDDLDGRVREGVTLRVLPNDPVLDFVAAGLNKDVNDNWLIAALIEDAASLPIVITDDAGLLMKLRARKIRNFRPPEDARLAPEEDEDTRLLREENKALKQRLDKRPRLALGFADGKNVLHVSARVFQPLEDPAEIVASRRREMLAQVERSRRPQAGASIRIPSAGPFSEEELEEYLSAFLAYHRALHEHADKASRTIGVELQLHNHGSAPASGIEIRIAFPDDVEAGVDMFPTADPAEPTLPKFFQAAWLHSLFGPHSSVKDVARRLRDATSLGRNYVEVAGLQDNRWHVAGKVITTSIKTLLHKRHIELTQFPIVFPLRGDQLTGFEAHAVILVATPADEMEVSLNFVPSRGAR